MNLLREDIVRHKLKIIEENIELIKEYLPENLNKFKKLGLVKDGIYKRIESSIQDIINICSIINTDLNLGIPSNRDEIISLLVENNIISSKMG